MIVVRARPGRSSQGILSFGGLTLPCALGRSGITALKAEGDGATPLAEMRVLGAYFRRKRGVPVPPALPAISISPSQGWCDDPDDRNYNRPVHLPYPASAERMRRDDRLYDTCVILDWNIRPRRRGCGSAIFLHVARSGHLPTEGCIALSPAAMARLLPYLTRDTVVRVVR